MAGGLDLDDLQGPFQPETFLIHSEVPGGCRERWGVQCLNPCPSQGSFQAPEPHTSHF